jgi:AcrR family transcriptional regulator
MRWASRRIFEEREPTPRFWRRLHGYPGRKLCDCLLSFGGNILDQFESGLNRVRRTKTSVAPGSVGAVPQKTTKVRRGRGRPILAGRTVGRAALIEATIELLKTTSHQKLSRLEIARFARVDPRLVRYYFGDKQQLLAEVAVQITRNFREQFADMSEGTPTQDRLRARVRRYVEIFLLYPHIGALVEETIFAGGNSAASKEWRNLIQQSLEQLVDLFEHRREGKRFRTVEHRYLHLLMIGATQFFANSSGLLIQMFGRGASPAKKKEEFITFVTDILLNGLKV